MLVPVVCEGCGRRYGVAETLAGKRGRCKHCGRVLTVPGSKPEATPASEEPEAYALEEGPDTRPSTFVAARGSSETGRGAPSKLPVKSKTRAVGKPLSPAARRAGLIGLGILLAFAVAASFVPGVLWASGLVVTAVGLILFFYGFATGAYIAFTEDSLHGMLFLLLPPYAAYYFVSRWEDMGSRLALVVGGLILLAFGGRMLEASVTRSSPAAAASRLPTRGEMARTGIVPACPERWMPPNLWMAPLIL